MSTDLDLRELMAPAALAAIGPLELLSRRVVDGFLSGSHRSTHKGGCFEFAEHRAYAAGDETRLIDWRVFARSDRYYIKRFEEETNLQALMVVDGSGSMQFAGSTISKYDYARLACACLSRLMLRQRDAVGLVSTATASRAYVPPRSNPHHLRSIADALVRARPGGSTSLASVLHNVGKRLKRRGLIIVFSDCFDNLPRLVKSLRLLRLRGHEVLMFHILAPEELNFTFDRWSRFECLETDGVHIELDPSSVRKAYLERLQTFLEDLKRECLSARCDLVSFSTEQNLGDALAFYLRRRTRSLAGRTARG
jgi:uncharacterized protein (DUF58 family)